MFLWIKTFFYHEGKTSYQKLNLAAFLMFLLVLLFLLVFLFQKRICVCANYFHFLQSNIIHIFLKPDHFSEMNISRIITNLHLILDEYIVIETATIFVFQEYCQSSSFPLLISQYPSPCRWYQINQIEFKKKSFSLDLYVVF